MSTDRHGDSNMSPSPTPQKLKKNVNKKSFHRRNNRIYSSLSIIILSIPHFVKLSIKDNIMNYKFLTG